MPSGMVNTLYHETDNVRGLQKFTIERGIGPESPGNTLERLGMQGDLNGIVDTIELVRTDFSAGGVLVSSQYRVSGQWHTEDGTPGGDGPYHVQQIKGVGTTCDCERGGIATGAACAHIGAMWLWLKRKRERQQQLTRETQ
jgi:hypothetical protein